MSEETLGRRTRGRQPKSYRFQDEYAFLDEDGNDATASGRGSHGMREDDDEDEEDDAFMPDAEEEEVGDVDEDEEMGELVNSGDDEHAQEEEVASEGEEIEAGKQKATASHSKGQTHHPDATHNYRGRRIMKRRAIDIEETSGSPSLQVPVPKAPKGPKVRPRGTDHMHNRGVAEFTKIGGQEVRLRDLYGPEDKDMEPILQTRDHWYLQETLPLLRPGFLRRSFFERVGVRELEIERLRSWYEESGKAAFAAGQKTKVISTDEAAQYMENDGPATLNVLRGSRTEPKLYTFQKETLINIADAFKKKENRHGYLLYLGSRIQEAYWMPKDDQGTQYLAVTVEQPSPASRQWRPLEHPEAPAFTATAPYPASIQIWAIDPDQNGRLDASKTPRLAAVVCADWGAPKYMKWCPMATQCQGEDSTNNSAPIPGILAVIWSDGHVRILDLSCIPLDETRQQPCHIHFSTAAFDVEIPHTIPTCLHWLSAQSLAVGTAEGHLAIWTLNHSEAFSPNTSTSSHHPRPWFYQRVAETYILTVNSGWPSRPQFICATTADGFARLFDVRNPKTDYVASIRGRTLCTTQAWHEQTQTFAMPDEYYMIKHNPLRRFYHNLYSMRLESAITRVATSPVHPALLVGNAGGEVVAGNPVARIVNHKDMPWQQVWFSHEWRGPVDRMVGEVKVEGADIVRNDGEQSATPSQDPTQATTPQTHSGPLSILAQPLTRFTEGHKVTQPGIHHSVASKKPANPDMGRNLTIYEEPSAITALAWNPNIKYGTWAVAGMGDGLLRVEDIGV